MFPNVVHSAVKWSADNITHNVIYLFVVRAVRATFTLLPHPISGLKKKKIVFHLALGTSSSQILLVLGKS